ncbi:ABC transporter permease [Sorangium cellulosum]|uniref:ABC transporter permease n=1 Tax=Sorangium cellulosum TaxID=56 RepID=A0A2L0EUA0_SORCE|nr:ABC transporter permease [Sorangium cellulosum]AUX42877.1 ABC transporter permease [Sorangium cellulosum]
MADGAELLSLLATALAASTPLVYAAVGETLTERAGVINLAAEGAMMLAAMVGFAAALSTGSVLAGFAAAAATGALVALVVAIGGVHLRRSQIAVGFVLAMLCADLSSVLGGPFVRVPGPTVPAASIPVLRDLPILGPLFFQSDPLVYASYALVAGVWLFLYRTRAGLLLRAVGEQPAAAHARGADVARVRTAATLVGGALVGIGGAAYSLDFKAGWSHRHTAGYGWIALAIVIFGGFHPVRAALGAYLFGVLSSLASLGQSALPSVPTQVFSVAPFALMIVVLAFTSSGLLERLAALLPDAARRPFLRAFDATPPASLGKPYPAVEGAGEAARGPDQSENQGVK